MTFVPSMSAWLRSGIREGNGPFGREQTAASHRPTGEIGPKSRG
jgi:hypothetical protein